jgi:hypothetical protein
MELNATHHMWVYIGEASYEGRKEGRKEGRPSKDSWEHSWELMGNMRLKVRLLSHAACHMDGFPIHPQ